MYELKHYVDLNGNNLFTNWLNSIKDRQGLARIKVILLCNGGDKSTQSADITKAISRWKDWQTRGINENRK